VTRREESFETAILDELVDGVVAASTPALTAGVPSVALIDMTRTVIRRHLDNEMSRDEQIKALTELVAHALVRLAQERITVRKLRAG